MKYVTSYENVTKVCDVAEWMDGTWVYSNIDEDLMFSDHESWVYFIVVGKKIWKIGESGNPLGIRPKTIKEYYGIQPVSNSKGRLGRYRGGDGTDYDIRELLTDDVMAGKVSIWAHKCDIVTTQISIIKGNTIEVPSEPHKKLEVILINSYYNMYGELPPGNKCRK